MTLLAADRRRCDVDLLATVPLDGAQSGAVCARGRGHAVRRAEPGPEGPLVLEARRCGDAVELEVWGAPGTPAPAVDAALHAAAAWVALDDDHGGFGDLVAGHRLLHRLWRTLGTPRLSRLPRVGEALGRAVIAQLVQSAEARRSTAQLAAVAGTPAPGALWAWPTPRQLAALPAHAMRGRAGVSLRGARALHAGALADRWLGQAADRCPAGRADGSWQELDRRLRALPGVGVWTAAEARLALGDSDTVSVGDHNLPDLVGAVLGPAAGLAPDAPGDRWTDAAMLDLLAPFASQRARVVRLVGMAVGRRLVRGPRRRAPRAAFSAHRYW